MWYVKKEEIEQAEQELAVLKKARKEYWALENEARRRGCYIPIDREKEYHSTRAKIYDLEDKIKEMKDNTLPILLKRALWYGVLLLFCFALMWGAIKW